MTLLLLLLLSVLFTEIIGWIGKNVLIDLLLPLYLYLFYPSLKSTQTTLKSTLLKTRQSLLQTSAQDEFAKWAKLRRALDKSLAELETTNAEIVSLKSSFGRLVGVAVFLGTSGVGYGLGWWFGRQAVVYVPGGGYLPLGVVWLLGLPFAPTGSVSVGVWQMACRRLIRVVVGVVREVSEKEEVKEEAKVKSL